MKQLTRTLWLYLKQHFAIIGTLILTIAIFVMIFSLYSLPLEAISYAALLIFITFSIIAMFRFLSYYRKHKTLEELKHRITVDALKFVEPIGQIEQDYQDLLNILDESRTSIISENDRIQTDMVDYYTLWAHQIKTPIAAMRLLLQSNPSEENDELLTQLFKINQYVEMALQYLRMENMSGDLMMKKYSLDDIVKQAIKKFSKTFIRKKISLKYTGLNFKVLTDEKWLVFVIEQLLSNALKYTNKGTISIYMDGHLPQTLVIEDTGIGIQPEDLPRVFEKGFTGYNGRADKKSTGIGLYLCQQIIKKLSHTIIIESKVGVGTRVKIGLDTVNTVIE